MRSSVMQEPTAEEETAAKNVFMANGILNGLYYMGRLGFYYDAGREVKVGCFYWHHFTKEEASANWPRYIQAALPAEVTMYIIQCNCFCFVSLVSTLLT